MSEDELVTFYNELQMEEDLINFISYNKTPKYLKKTETYQYSRMKNLCPELNPIGVYDLCEYTTRKHYMDVSRQLKSSIHKCHDVIRVITMPTYKPETCPICICEFEETNYVLPKCGHKVCAVCFTKNIKYNKVTGDCCVLCRKRIC